MSSGCVLDAADVLITFCFMSINSLVAATLWERVSREVSPWEMWVVWPLWASTRTSERRLLRRFFKRKVLVVDPSLSTVGRLSIELARRSGGVGCLFVTGLSPWLGVAEGARLGADGGRLKDAEGGRLREGVL